MPDFTNQNLEIEKSDSILLFNESLINVFKMDKDENFEIFDSYNLTLIKIILDDNNFKKRLENALYENKEVLTSKLFKLEGKALQPTIGNWLADFIKLEGTKMFDNVVISRFITKSENAKNLSAEERDLVGKLLILYRNLKYFPESMAGVPVEDWAIIPVGKSEELLKARHVSGPPMTEEEKKIEEFKEAEERLAKSDLEKKVIEEAGVQAQRRIEDLKILAKKYKGGSLEQKAIKEEIDKLERQ